MKEKSPSLYVNRGLSWLEFNQRVLEQAQEGSTPLLERIKFLGIVSSNLDEFFEVYIAALNQQCYTYPIELSMDGMTPQEELEALRERIRVQIEDQYRLWREEVLPELKREEIFFLGYDSLKDFSRSCLQHYFDEFVFPLLTPLAIDPSHPFPQLANLSLNVAVMLEGDKCADLAIVQIPGMLPRIISCGAMAERERKEKEEDGEEPQHGFIFIEELIRHHLEKLFYGVKIRGAYLFRVTRNSNLTIEEEESENLLNAIEEELRHVHRSAPIRLEVESSMPQGLKERLLDLFHLKVEALYPVDGPLQLQELFSIVGEFHRPDLGVKRFRPALALRMSEGKDLFWHLQRRDMLLHHPYDSFQTVLDFLGHAAEDPHTIAIKLTLYRTSNDSPLVSSLIAAAKNGKQVTVVIELKARFDEAANIKWARIMREAGINVIYGVSRLKTHAKALLIIRQEGESIRRYAHLSTGNYNPITARVYTDLGFLTADPELTEDVSTMFNMLTGVARFPKMNKLCLAPHHLQKKLLALVKREIEHAQQGRPASIFLKMNALIEKGMIDALYKASQAGVKCRLLIRGICCLRPGVPGLSEHIEVRSIVGKLLEHSRLLRFENGGDVDYFLTSADWMPRNLFRRVETLFPVEDKRVQAHLEEIITLLWQDNVKARVMNLDGKYEKVVTDESPYDAQESLILDAQQRRAAR